MPQNHLPRVKSPGAAVLRPIRRFLVVVLHHRELVTALQALGYLVELVTSETMSDFKAIVRS